MDCTRFGNRWPRRAVLLAGLSLRAQGWETLFDGKTTAGWIGVAGQEFPSDCWVVEDGCLRSVVQKPTFQDIRTEREFGDFELEFAWRIATGGNSGVKYLIRKYDAWTPAGVTAARPHARARGCEYQLADDEGNADARRDATRGTGSLYGESAAETGPRRKAGDWNESRILVRRPAVEHWLNGTQVVSVRLPGALPERSAISLQNHSSVCWFRSIQVRSLD